jgi:hypothetical protein
MSTPSYFLRNLAAAFLAGPRTVGSMVNRGTRACGTRPPWLRSLVRRILGTPALGQPDLTEDDLARWIAAHQFWLYAPYDLVVRVWYLAEPPTAPVAGQPATWTLPCLPSSGALADWLGLSVGELDWFADCHHLTAQAPPGPLRHYTYQWLRNRSGQARLLEMPKQRLKAIQRRLLHAVLDRIPAHDAAHGFRPGRSVVSYAAPHAGKVIVLRFDLRQFFPSVRAAQVHALFRTAGYPFLVARLLTGLCTTVVPEQIWRQTPTGCKPMDVLERSVYQGPHLPQGAPTSPALANLITYRLDCRLSGLARMVAADYTRYADDLAFSGDERLERSARRFQVQVARIALEEGFEIQTRKSRFMRRGVRQQLAGVVVNVHPNIARAEYDRLKAILHNCVCRGPASQNREQRPDFRAFLVGRIAYISMLNSARGGRLWALFDRIHWEQ